MRTNRGIKYSKSGKFSLSNRGIYKYGPYFTFLLILKYFGYKDVSPSELADKLSVNRETVIQWYRFIRRSLTTGRLRKIFNKSNIRSDEKSINEFVEDLRKGGML